MSAATQRLTLVPETQARVASVRVWRPFQGEGAEIVEVEDCGGEIRPRMHSWFGISLVRSPAVLTIEARREVVLDRNSIVLIPGFQLYGLRQRGQPAEGAVTLLLDGSHLEGLGLSAQAALVTDAVVGEGLAALLAPSPRPAPSADRATAIRSVLERLAAHGTPLTPARDRGINSLIAVRDYLRAQVSQPVATEELRRMSGLSAPYLIRAFHYEFGLPPHAYHMRVRLAAACELLTRGLAVASVAYERGFADQSHLSRKFKAVYGVSPAAWAAAAAGRTGMPGRCRAPTSRTRRWA